MVFYQVLINAISLGFVFAVLGIGLSLIYGTVGLVNFAHGEVLMISMYTAYWVYALFALDPLWAIPFAAVILFVLGIIIHTNLASKVIKAGIVTQIFATYGLSIFLASSAQFLWGPDFRSVPRALVRTRVALPGVVVQSGSLIVIVVSVVVLLALLWFIYKTETGQAILAVSEDAETASLMGIDPEKMYKLVWGISLGIIGVTGAILGGMYYSHPNVGVSFGIYSFIAVAMGGFGSIPGAFAGAFLVGFIQVFAAYYFPPSLKLLFVVIVFMVVLAFKPRGFFGRY